MRKNSRVSFFIGSVLAAAVFATVTLSSGTTAFAVTREEALEYAESKIGKVVGSGQCVAYVKDYYKSVFGESVRGNGSDYINNTPKGFTQILYGSDEWDPQPGDIVSWSWNKYGGKYGHVGIITRVDKKGFYYLNQNPYPVQESRYKYSQSGWTLAGVVRPPYEDEVVDSAEETMEAVQELIPETEDGMYDVGLGIHENQSYAIVSTANNKYLNVYCDTMDEASNGTAINLWKKTGGDENSTQRFRFRKVSENTYLVLVQDSKFTLNISSRKENTNILAWKDREENNEPWIVEKNGDGYTFRLMNKPNLYLTQTGSKLTLKPKAEGKSQIFLVE